MAIFSLNTQRLAEICRKNDVSMLGIFGSMARGEATDQSDVDLVVRFNKPKSLLSVVRIEREMANALSKKVDLLTEAAISPYLRKGILNELQVIYET